jgi:PIN domain nuclease of toxin-antitoxin system
MKALLDTHFVLWILLSSKRLADHPWLERYRPWGLSPVSLLEIAFLGEVGRIEVRYPDLTDRLLEDSRFAVDEVALLPLVRTAIDLDWTRDPFDRLLAAHSEARRVPLITLDRGLRRNHGLIVKELRSPKEAATGG